MPRLIAKGALFASMWISAGLPVPASEPENVSVRKIWDRGEHNAFSDLIRFQDRWWCTFREAKDHGPSLGQVRVIVSTDGEKWESAALLEEREVDLRDPKLSIMPDGRLMLIMGGSVYRGTPFGTRSPRVSFSADGRQWISYYSSHEGKTSIYLATIRFKN